MAPLLRKGATPLRWQQCRFNSAQVESSSHRKFKSLDRWRTQARQLIVIKPGGNDPSLC